jgi:hypothetical protein
MTHACGAVLSLMFGWNAGLLRTRAVSVSLAVLCIKEQ